MKPLEDLLVLEFSQYMSGPLAGLKLADLGARIIKVEPPVTGEGGRNIDIKGMYVDDNSLLFHTINRNKESYVANLKVEEDFQKVENLIARADVMTHNFRPGVMESLGLDYKRVNKINPQIVYAEISGYGTDGPWSGKPGQDLLIQAMSGLTYLSGDRGDLPTPFGLSVIDILCGNYLVQGILASLVQRGKTNEGAHVEISLLETALDLQFEVITTFLNDGGKLPNRAKQGNAHAYLGAPYGIYKTVNGYLALAMTGLDKLGKIVGLESLGDYSDKDYFDRRDEIMDKLRAVFKTKSTDEWLAQLEPADIWCADVKGYKEFLNHKAYQILDMDQTLELTNGKELTTTRCPIRIDEKRFFSSIAAPQLGEHTKGIDKEFALDMTYEENIHEVKEN
ncbi:CaiB/BaiF CoA transferase family protein [Fodinibius salsisoli]|uniref:CoA transferase n=1 Tax=Fodinibius salsisoli TaxID=2820877 RepID=A0ABT3PHR1_9BACT|nr:CoA transferase [Fodinibius salsisoli]